MIDGKRLRDIGNLLLDLLTQEMNLNFTAVEKYLNDDCRSEKTSFSY